MTSNLVPTPIVDRNGKQTVVHKSASTAGKVRANLVGAHPVVAGREKESSDALFPRLRAFQMPDVTEFYDAGRVMGTESVGRSFRGIMNLFKYYSDKGVLGPRAIGALLTQMDDRYKSDEKTVRSRAGSEAEQHGKNLLLVLDYLQSIHPKTDDEMRRSRYIENLSAAMEGCYRTNTPPSSPFVLTTPEQVRETAGSCAYVVRMIENEGDYITAQDSPHLLFQNRMGFDSGRVTAFHKKSSTIDSFVRKNPELALQVADFVHTRKIGKTKGEAQYVVDYFTDQSAVMEGWL